MQSPNIITQDTKNIDDNYRFYTKIAECIVSISLAHEKVSKKDDSLDVSSTTNSPVESTDLSTSDDLASLIYLWNKSKRHPMVLLQRISATDAAKIIHDKIPAEKREIFDILNSSDNRNNGHILPISNMIQNNNVLRISPEELAYMRYHNETEELTLTNNITNLSLILGTPKNRAIVLHRSYWRWRKLARRIVLDFARYLEELQAEESNSDPDDPRIRQPLVIATGKVKLPEENDLLSITTDITKFNNKYPLIDKTIPSSTTSITRNNEGNNKNNNSSSSNNYTPVYSPISVSTIGSPTSIVSTDFTPNYNPTTTTEPTTYYYNQSSNIMQQPPTVYYSNMIGMNNINNTVIPQMVNNTTMMYTTTYPLPPNNNFMTTAPTTMYATTPSLQSIVIKNDGTWSPSNPSMNMGTSSYVNVVPVNPLSNTYSSSTLHSSTSGAAIYNAPMYNISPQNNNIPFNNNNYYSNN